MKKKLMLRKAHRYIGLFISIQLLLWTLGGIYFSWTDIDEIHGDDLKSLTTEKDNIEISAQQILEGRNDILSVKGLNTSYLAQKPIYHLDYISTQKKPINVLIDAITGKEITEISEPLAKEIAIYNASFKANIISSQYLTETDGHHEYREKALPAWAITFDHDSSPTFYINAKSGKLESVRHDSWRVFDFLWMLHTMDYQSRDDFGNWLIKIFSIIALITSISGIILFVISTRRSVRRSVRSN
jgi:hypothetical protein